MAGSEKKDMSFLDHLDELRKHIIRSVLAIIVMTIVAFTQMKWIYQVVLLGPTKSDFITFRVLCDYFSYCVETLEFTLISRTMTGQFTMHLLASVVAGIVFAFPYIVYELWQFVAPALHKNERTSIRGIVFFISLLFFLGVVFGYFIMSPLAINFLLNYQIDPSIKNFIDISSYISMLCMMVLGGGLIFQLPVVVYALSSLGLMTPQFMRSYRRHALVVIFIIAAVLTPSPDILSQVLMALPMIFLYELSIYVSAYIYAKKEKESENYNEHSYE